MTEPIHAYVYIVEAVPFDNPDAFTVIDSVWSSHKAASKRQSGLQATREYYGVRVVNRRIRRSNEV